MRCGFWLNMRSKVNSDTYLTPHPGEAAKLLNCTVAEIEQDRIHAIHQLQQRYAGQWVLKGAGSLILEDTLWICTAESRYGNGGVWAMCLQE